MPDTLHIVTYTGPFGFIKPWTAVRDEQTYSQQFLTPSIVEGMRQKLEVSAILRYRLTHKGFSIQQETTQSRGYKRKTVKKYDTVEYQRDTSIIERGVMLSPQLHLAFPTVQDARKAHSEHLCLCRNEDVVYPTGEIQTLSEDQFDALTGFELLFEDSEDAFLVGYNRFEDGAPMYGRLSVTGNPVEQAPVAA